MWLNGEMENVKMRNTGDGVGLLAKASAISATLVLLGALSPLAWGAPQIQINKVIVDGGLVQFGSDVTFEITVTNTGDVTLNVRARDALRTAQRPSRYAATEGRRIRAATPRPRALGVLGAQHGGHRPQYAGARFRQLSGGQFHPPITAHMRYPSIEAPGKGRANEGGPEMSPRFLLLRGSCYVKGILG